MIFSGTNRPRKYLIYPFEAVAGGFVVAFAMWTIYCHYCIYTNQNFEFLKSYSLAPFAFTIILYALFAWVALKRHAVQQTPIGREPLAVNYRISLQIKATLVLAIVAIYYFSNNFLIFW